MAVSIIVPQQQEAGVDKFLRRVGGLAQIANQGLGTYKDVHDLQTQNQATEDARNGVYGVKEIDPSKWVDAKDGDTDTQNFQVRDAEGGLKTLVKKRYVEPTKALSDVEKRLKEAEISKLGAEASKLSSEAGAGKEYKPDQYQAGTFANRAAQADKDLGELLQTGYDPSGKIAAFQASKWNPEFNKPEDAKLYNQAKNNFISAVLRKESGAAISDAEREAEAAKYFPQAGDTDKVKEQKSLARNAAMAGLRAEAGGALAQVERQNKQGGGLSDLISSPKKTASTTQHVKTSAGNFSLDDLKAEAARRAQMKAR